MDTLLTIIHVTVALFMILVVLIQGGNQGGVGAAFGGGNSQGVFGASGATTLLGKLTYAAAAIFMVTSLSLSVRPGGGRSFDPKVLNRPVPQAPAAFRSVAADADKAKSENTEVKKDTAPSKAEDKK